MTLEEQNNKYKNWYYRIINNRLTNPILNQYTETHHIIPKCLGGSNYSSNLVKLTAREHYICHLLLIEKNGITKETKRENLHMYKKYGWSLIDRLYGNGAPGGT